LKEKNERKKRKKKNGAGRFAKNCRMATTALNAPPENGNEAQTAIPYHAPVQSKKRKLGTQLLEHQPRKKRPVFDAEIVKEMRQW
jgi:hypothetical protein